MRIGFNTVQKFLFSWTHPKSATSDALRVTSTPKQLHILSEKHEKLLFWCVVTVGSHEWNYVFVFTWDKFNLTIGRYAIRCHGTRFRCPSIDFILFGSPKIVNANSQGQKIVLVKIASFSATSVSLLADYFSKWLLWYFRTVFV